jgi:hypothetical protein
LNCKFTNKRLLHEFAGFFCHPFKEPWWNLVIFELDKCEPCRFFSF